MPAPSAVEPPSLVPSLPLPTPHAAIALTVALLTGVACGPGTEPDGDPKDEDEIELPSAPTLSAATGDASAILTWGDVEDADSYVLYFGAGELDAESATQVAQVASPYTVSDLENDTEYSFAVAAKNSAGEGAWSNVVTVTPTADLQAPAAPTNVVAVAGDGLVTVSWDDVKWGDAYDLYWSDAESFDEKTAQLVESVISPYEVTGLANGVEYSFAIVARNTAGSSPISDVVSALLAPNAPTNVAAVAGDGQVTVSWEDVVGADAYDLYWSDVVPFDVETATLVESVTSPYEVTGLPRGVEFHFAVVARNATGKGPLSGVASATTALGAPENVTALLDDGQITVSWAPVEDAVSYDLYWSDATPFDVETATLVESATSPWELTGLTNGLTYGFAVAARSPEGPGHLSTVVSVTLAPDAPTNVEAVPEDEQVVVTWNDVVGAVTYDLYWSDETPLNDETATLVESVTSPYAVTELTKGIEHHFAVVARNAAGPGALSNVVSAIVSLDAPRNVVVTADADRVTVTWEDVVGADAYDLFWSDVTPFDVESATVIESVTSPHDLVGLPKGLNYHFAVAARKGDSRGHLSTVGSIVVSLDVPTNVAASDGEFEDRVAVTWNAVDYASKYIVLRDSVEIGETTDTSWDDTTATPGAPDVPTLTTSYNDYTDRVEVSWTPTYDTSTVHSYRVIAVRGEVESDISEPDEGHKRPAVTGYEVSVDGGDTFTGVGLVTLWDDFDAPAGTITPGTMLASQGEFTTHVELSLSGTSLIAGAERSYAVRAVTAAGPGPISSIATGRRGLGELTYQWQRSDHDSDGDYSDLSEATEVTHADPADNQNREGRYYRCVVSADGADTVFSAPARGYVNVVFSDVPRARFGTVDGSVYSMQEYEGTIYVGGDFQHAGPSTGTLASLDLVTGAVHLGGTWVDGPVHAAIPDGEGGLYIGGNFTSVGGKPRRNLARILEDREVDPDFNPSADQTVHALALNGTTLYAGGDFRNANGVTRNRLAAFHTSSGELTDWNPNSSGTVHALAISGDTVYAGGTFASIGANNNPRLAAIDASTGTVHDWRPDPNSSVRALAVSGSTLYVGGEFSGIEVYNDRRHVAAFDTTTGQMTNWNPNADSAVHAIAISENTAFLGGSFSSVGGQSRNGIAAVDATTGAVSSWTAEGTNNGIIYALAVHADTLYAGGHANSLAGFQRLHLGAFDVNTGAVTSWNGNANGPVRALTITGGSIFAGGDFSSVGMEARRNLAAFDGSTGALTDWNPSTNGRVDALAAAGNTLFAGGYFSFIDGEPQSNLAAFDLDTGKLKVWDLSASSATPQALTVISSLVARENTVYVGGNFASIGGESRTRLAAIDATSGMLTSWNPGANQNVSTIVINHDTIYVGGSFTNAGSQTRSGLAAFDASTGQLKSWGPSIGTGQVNALAISGDTLYVGGTFTTAGGQSRNRLAAFTLSTGQITPWNPSANNQVYSLAATNSTVYVGGLFSNVGGQVRNYIAAVDASTAQATDWTPRLRNPAGVDASLRVRLLVNGGNALYMGGENTSYPGIMHLYAFDLEP